MSYLLTVLCFALIGVSFLVTGSAQDMVLGGAFVAAGAGFVAAIVETVRKHA